MHVAKPKGLPAGFRSTDALGPDDEGRSVEVVTACGEVRDGYFRYWPNGQLRWRDADEQAIEIEDVIGWRESGTGEGVLA